MWPIRILLPLRPRRLHPRLLLTILNQLLNTPTSIIARLIPTLGFPRDTHLLAEFLGCALIDREIFFVDDDTVVAGGAVDGY